MEAVRPSVNLQEEISRLADGDKVEVEAIALALSSSGTRATGDDVRHALESLGISTTEGGQKVEVAAVLNIIGALQKRLSIPTGSFTGASSLPGSGGDWMDMLSNTPSSFSNSPGGAILSDDEDPEQLRSKNTQLTMRLESLESKLSQSDSSQMDLLDRLRKQQDSMVNVQKQSSLVKKLEEEKRRLEDELEALKVTARDLKDQIRELNRKENESTAEKTRLQQEISSRDREIVELEKRMAGLKSKVDDDAAAKSIAKLKAAAEAAEKQAQEKIDQLVKEKEALENKISELAKVNQTFQQKQLQTEQALDEVRKKLKDAEAASAATTLTPTKKKSSLASELEATPSGAPELEQKVQVLEELRVLLQSEKEDLTRKVKALEDEKAKLNAALTDSEDKRKSIVPADPNVLSQMAVLEKNIKLLETERTSEVQKRLEQQQKLWDQEKQQLGVQFDKMIAKLQEEKSILEQNLLQTKQEVDTLKAMRPVVIAAPPAAVPPPVPAKPIPLLENGPEIIAELNDLRIIKTSLEEEVKKLKDQLTLATLKAKSLKPRQNVSDDIESGRADVPLLGGQRPKRQEGCCACCIVS